MNMARRNAQMAFGETLMVVIILVFLIMIGLVFYFNVSKSGLEREHHYREDIEAIKLAKVVLTMPEIRTTEYSGTGSIDKLKLEKLGTLLNESNTGTAAVAAREYCGELFGYATIKLQTVTTSGVTTAATIYDDKPNANLTVMPQYIFTTLYDPGTGRRELAYLNVTRYSLQVFS